MIDSMEWKRQLSTVKPLVKGYNFFMSKHVLSAYQQKKDAKHFVKSQVLPSMKKKMVYTCYIRLSSLGYVVSAKCGCPAGIDGRCNHVCATLFYLDSFYKNNSKQCNDESSCTSKPCKWNIPRKRKGEVEPISSMKFRKHDCNKVNKRPIPSKNDAVQSRTATPEPVGDEKLKVLFKRLKELEKETGKVIGWCHILPQDLPEQNREAEGELISPIKITESPISIDCIKKRVDKIKTKLFIDDTQAAEIEKQTKDQSSNKSWHFHRQYRITASKCYRAAVLKSTTSPTKAVHDILYGKVVPTKQMRRGLEMESEIMDNYVKEQHKCGHSNLSVEKSGLIVGKFEDGFLGASPDGLVHDPICSDDPNGLLEMKFIDTEENESLNNAMKRKNICIQDSKRDTVTLNRNHKYFYQIQQGMYLSDRNWTDFVVAGSRSLGMHIERVTFDSHWWDRIKDKLKDFYDKYILIELAYPKIKYGLPRNDELRPG